MNQRQALQLGLPRLRQGLSLRRHRQEPPLPLLPVLQKNTGPQSLYMAPITWSPTDLIIACSIKDRRQGI